MGQVIELLVLIWLF